MSKKQLFLIALVVGLFSLSVVSFAFAQASGPPQKDTYVTKVLPDNSYGSDTVLDSTASGFTDDMCQPSRRIYMEWDLTSITDPNQLSSATLTLPVLNFAIGSPSNVDVVLYESADPTDLNAITWNTQPVIGNSIETQPAAGTGGTIVFNSSALVAYLQSQAGGIATLMFQLEPKQGVTVCHNDTLQVASIEASFGTPADLQVAGPNAVTLSSFSTSNGQASWPLVLGLVGLAAVVAGSAFGLRRFTS